MDVAILDQDLKDRGLKVTMPRMKVMAILNDSRDKHLAAEDVYQLLRDQSIDVSLATVYRVLTQFVQAGLVRRHCFDGDRAVYELDDGEAHNHSVCIRCAKVLEFVDLEIENRLKAIAKSDNFTMSDYNIVLYGICQQCQA